MELRDYVDIIRRRWPIVAAVTAIAFVAATLLAFRGPRAYEATTRMVVSMAVETRGDVAPYVYQRDYYAWLASEYLADDLSEVIKSDAFAEDIRAQLNEDVDRSSIRDVLRTRKTHRILEVTAQAPTADRARRIAATIGDVIRTKGSKYIAELAAPGGQVIMIDDPVVKASTTAGSQAADIALRVFLGLLAGLFLAVLVDYLDPTLRTGRAVQASLGLPILGEIPAGAR